MCISTPVHHDVVVRITITLPDELYKQLRKKAFTEKKSLSKLILEGVAVRTPTLRVPQIKAENYL